MRRRGTNPRKATRPTPLQRMNTSVSGNRVSSGVYADDPNPVLRGRRWVETVDQMMLDARLFGALRALTQTLLSADLTFAPPEGVDSALAQECADHFNSMFGFAGQTGTMRKPFERQLETMLRFVALGWRYSEIDYQRQPDGSWGIAEFLDCKPLAHYQWLPLDGKGPFEGVRQLDPNGSSVTLQEVVPADRLLLLTLNQEGDSPEGFGLFRPCWFPWRLKSHTHDQMGIGVERSATGITSAEIDQERLLAQGYTPEQINNAFRDGPGIWGQVQNAVANVAAGQEAQIVFPAGVTFTTVFNKSFDPERLRAVVDLQNEEMLTVFLNAFLMLGLSSSGGSYALGQTQRDLFTETATNILQQVTQTICGPAGPGTGPVGRVIDWHPRFSVLPQAERPRIVISGLDVAPFMEVLKTLPALAERGIVTQNDALERAINRKTGLPVLPPDGSRTPAERMAPDPLTAAMVRNAGGNDA